MDVKEPIEDEKILNKEQWKKEAAAVIEDIKSHVCDASIAQLEGSDEHIFLNITTVEGRMVCVKMSKEGFTIVGNGHNRNVLRDIQWYETPYALLDKISPKYRSSFANQLILRLKKLQECNEDCEGK